MKNMIPKITWPQTLRLSFIMLVACPLLSGLNTAAGQYYTEVSTAQLERPYYSVERYAETVPELQRTISLKAENQTIKYLLEEIARSAGLGIVFDANLKPLQRKIRVDLTDVPVNYALENVLFNTGYEAALSPNRELMLKPKVFADFPLPAKIEQEISGTVYDAQTGETLPAVNVVVVGTTVGTSTSSDGAYTLTAPDDADTLQFSFIGYQQLRVAIDGRSTIDVRMQPSVEALDELVVTSFGIEEEKRSLGYSVQEVSGEEITETEQPNLLSSLQGKLAGVNIQNTSGAAGAGVDIVIRGITSLSPNSNNQPLFVVDGIPISNATTYGNVLPSEGTNSPGSSEQFSFTNRAADINPENIESVSILKGSGATALYGQRAANGAVIITTKRGSAGAPTVNFNTSLGFSEVNKTPDIQREYQHGRYGALPFTVFGFEFYQLGPPVRDDTEIFNNFERLFRTGTNVNNSISVSGGNENTTYFTSVSNLSQEGIVPNTDFGRTTFKISGSQNIQDKVTITGSVNYANSGGVRPTGGDKSIMSSLSFFTPSNDINDFRFPDGSQKNYSGNRDDLNGGFIDNPRFFAENSTLEDDVNRVFGDVGFKFNFTDWLALDYKFGADYYNDSRERFVPPILDVGSQVNGFLVEESINYREINSNAYLRAEHNFTDKISGSFLLGNQITDIKTTSVNTRGEGLNIPDFRSLANTTNVFTSEDGTLSRLIGVFANAEIEYDDTWFLTLTGRNDWSSTLPENNRSFFYPSASLGYVFTETLGLDDNDILTFGKLRLSWAQVGKDAPPFSVGQYFRGAFGFPFSGTGGFTRDPSAGTSDLKPEITTSFEVGTDLQFLDNRLGLDVTYFNQTSENQIVAFPVSNASGLARFTTNAGEIESQGLEVLLNAKPVFTNDFSWDVSVNWSSVSSEVISMPEGLDVIEFASSGFAGIVNRIQVGGELGDLFGFAYERDDNGNLLIADDGLPTINADTLVQVGNALPDWQGGMTNTFNYKNLALSFLIEVRMGADAYDSGQRNALRNGILEITGLRNEEVIFDGVNADGSENDIPVKIGEEFYRSSTRFNRAAEILVQDASWFRLRNARIAYNLPNSLMQKLPISSARFSVTGNNLFLSTPFRGFDPEGQQFAAGSNTYGFTGLNIPPTRSVTFSLNLKF